jgi:hypothetical protein
MDVHMQSAYQICWPNTVGLIATGLRLIRPFTSGPCDANVALPRLLHLVEWRFKISFFASIQSASNNRTSRNSTGGSQKHARLMAPLHKQGWIIKKRYN